MTFKPVFLCLVFAIVVAVMAETIAMAAGGRVDITPRRVILNPRDRGGEFTLLNLGQEESTIRVSILHYRQDENGAYSVLDAPLNPVFDPEQTIRLSPRQFTLPSGGRQKIRFSVRKPADLPEGEYRFHILASRMANFGPPEPVDPGEKSVGVVPNIGVAIPVIVRHGNVQASATISDLAYVPSNKDGKPEIQFVINRTGNASTIGQAKVLWIPQSGEGAEAGMVTNLNIFPEVSKRNVSIPLTTVPSGSGRFHVIYMNEETKTPYAEADLAH